jgi:uncharacterized protein (DUF2141 family)
MFKKFLLILLLLLNFTLSAGENPKTKVTIKIQGLKNNIGTVKVALCNSLENYKDHKAPFIGLNLPISNNQAEITLSDLPAGYYAVKAFHDVNNNNDLDTNILGIPVEDYGFSNNASGIFGPPSWNKAKLMIQDGYPLIIINMN